MRKKSFFLSGVLGIMLFCMSIFTNSYAQTTIYFENFGMPTGNTLIQNYIGWQNRDVIYTGDGTCDVRATSVSTGYGLASGGGNVMINDTIKWFMVSGINTSTQNDLSLCCGLRKTTAENGNNFVVEISSDSVHWTRLSLADTLPTGAGTSGWHRVCYPGIPAVQNLHIRFSNLVNVDYRLDDIAIVVGEEVDLDTNLKVELPLDLSNNSNEGHLEIKSLVGFQGYNLGASASDGSAKFEPDQAGEACLIAHLDSAPDSLVFELRGTNTGGNSPSYEGIMMMVSSSSNGVDWQLLATIFAVDIDINTFTHFVYRIADTTARYVRWKLETAVKGNTYLNNIKITKNSDRNDSASVSSFQPELFGVYPNPTYGYFNVYFGKHEVYSLTLYNIYGQVVRTWSNPNAHDRYDVVDLPRGTYVLKATTPYGTIQKKIVRF